MPARTRAGASSNSYAPVDRVYVSPQLPQQVEFRARKKRVTARHSLGGTTRLHRQSTLTQYDITLERSPDNEEYDQDDLSIHEEQGQQRKKRRKTEGDTPGSLTDLHTQTLTQMLDRLPPRSPYKMDDIFGNFTETNSPISDPVDDTSRCGSGYTLEDLTVDRDVEHGYMVGSNIDGQNGQPKTPRQIRFEIPSSQSPTTPLSIQSRSTKGCRSPLLRVASNIQPSQQSLISPTLPKIISIPVKLEIEDTFDYENDDSQVTAALSSPSKRSSPRRGVRFASELMIHSNASRCGTSTLYTRLRSTPIIKNEIEDSEAESEDDQETFYDDLGLETQLEAGALVSSIESQCLDLYPRSPHYEETVDLPPVSQYSQYHRLSTEDFNSMAPRSDRSDIIISIHPQHVAKIVDRSKDHEFRTWAIPNQVTRVWIYETKPASMIQYMAVIGPAKLPGEIKDLKGTGNREFNTGQKLSRYAYEIQELYELANPVSLENAKANGWLGGAPQKFIYVRPAVLDYLMANLRPAVFSSKERPVQPSSDSQDATAQLQSTIQQFLPSSSATETHIVGSRSPTDSPSLHSTANNSRISSLRNSNTTMSGLGENIIAPHLYVGLGDDDKIVDEDEEHIVIPESPSFQVPSSIPLPVLSGHVGLQQIDDMPLPFSLASSQLLTRSQMLPDSLIKDSAPSPPPFMQESDAE